MFTRCEPCVCESGGRAQYSSTEDAGSDCNGQCKKWACHWLTDKIRHFQDKGKQTKSKWFDAVEDGQRLWTVWRALELQGWKKRGRPEMACICSSVFPCLSVWLTFCWWSNRQPWWCETNKGKKKRCLQSWHATHLMSFSVVKGHQMPYNLSSFHVATDQSCHQKLAYDNDQQSVAHDVGHSQQHQPAQIWSFHLCFFHFNPNFSNI